MAALRSSILFIFAVIVILLASSCYTIKEGQAGLVLRMGRVVTHASGGAAVQGPGLHLKLPFVDKIKKFDMRLQTEADKTKPIYIQDEYYLVMDYYVKWRINDLALYYIRTGGDPTRAVRLMQQRIDAGLRSALGTLSLAEVVAQNISDSASKGSVKQNNRDILTDIKKRVIQRVSSLGVEVIDVRLRAIDLPPQVRQSVFDSMRAGRQQVANMFRAEGRRQETEIKAKADAMKVTTIANAKRDAEQTRAAGLAMAGKIYNAAFNKNPQFYAFYRSLLAYQNVFQSAHNVLVLQPGEGFFKYFKHATVGTGRGALK